MSLKTILFDLDGTLLRMDQEKFIQSYFEAIGRHMEPLGWDSKKLLDAIWHSTGVMMKNDGSRTNEEAFWQHVCTMYGPNARDCEPILDEFYRNHFHWVRDQSCSRDPDAAKVVRKLKELGFRLVLATNPLFPEICTKQRIAWAGLEPEDFDLVTTYEHFRFCKPDPRYFSEILEKLGERAENCLMVGNDAHEDTCIETLGVPVFLITRDLLNRHNRDISGYPQGDLNDLLRFVEAKL